MRPADEIHAGRIGKLRLELLRTHDTHKGKEKKPLRLDGLIVSDLVNIGYLTGFTGSAGVALVMPDRGFLVVDSRYTNQAREECQDFEVVATDSFAGATKTLAETIAKYPGKLRLGFEADNVHVSQLNAWEENLGKSVRLKSAAGITEKLRAIKDSGEVDAIRAAIRLAEAAFKKVFKLLVAGTVESKFAAEIEIAMRQLGAQKAAFDTIVASGPNGARPHHGSSGRAFENGELVTIDWGCELDGYCSDLTRTVPIGGGAMDTKQRDVYETVLQAKNMATAAIKPGVTGKAIDDIARDHIAARGYGDYFGHSLGHGLGLVVHDGPTLSQRAEHLILKAGMVTTVEPGIYIDGWGGVRIEDDVLVTETGYEILSTPAT